MQTITDCNGNPLYIKDYVKFTSGDKIFTIKDIVRNKAVVASGNKMYIVDGSRLRWLR